MNDRDVLMLICARSDDRVLKSLSRTSIWFLIREFVGGQHFWYLRTQFLLPTVSLDQLDSSDWRSVYHTMSDISKKEGEEKFTRGLCGNVTCLKIMLQMGYELTFGAMNKAIETGNPEAVRFTLLHNQKRSNEEDGYALGTAVEYDNTELLSILIEEGKIDPSMFNSHVLDSAAAYGSYRCVKRLLEDERLDPTANGNSAALVAIQNGYSDIANLILADRRMNKQGLDVLIDEIRDCVDLEEEDNYANAANMERWLQQLAIGDERW